MAEFVRKNHFWLLDKEAFTPEYLTQENFRNLWLRQFQPTQEALEMLEKGQIPTLAGLAKLCSVFETERFIVIPTDCITNAKL